MRGVNYAEATEMMEVKYGVIIRQKHFYMGIQTIVGGSFTTAYYYIVQRAVVCGHVVVLCDAFPVFTRREWKFLVA